MVIALPVVTHRSRALTCKVVSKMYCHVKSSASGMVRVTQSIQDVEGLVHGISFLLSGSGLSGSGSDLFDCMNPSAIWNLSQLF